MRTSRLLHASRNKRKAVGVTDDGSRKVYVGIRPVEVTRGGFFDVQNLLDGQSLEPREGIEGNKEFLPAGEEPETMC